MSSLHTVITARAPLVFSERRPGGQFRQSTPYVPGAVLRGAMAQQLLDAGEQNHSDFATLFTAPDAPLFRNAYPAQLDKTTPAGLPLSSHPLPATALSCKAESGFDRHGVFDSLIDRLCCEQLGVAVPYVPRCSKCHDRVEAYGGFYVTTSQGERGVSVPSQLTTHVALNRRRKVAEEGLLYSPLVITEATADGVPTTFHGSIVVNDANRSMVENRLRQLTHIGSGPARGLGRVKIEVENVRADDLKERVAIFNARVRERWAKWSQLTGTTPFPEGAFFSVLLLSDAVLHADGWTPTVRVEPKMLGVAGARAVLLRCHATADYRGGWNTAWGLPKDTELVARMGSAYAYHTPHRPDDEGWLSALRRLEESGVGERRAEGFGQARVCDRFHLKIQEVTACPTSKQP